MRMMRVQMVRTDDDAQKVAEDGIGEAIIDPSMIEAMFPVKYPKTGMSYYLVTMRSGLSMKIQWSHGETILRKRGAEDV